MASTVVIHKLATDKTIADFNKVHSPLIEELGPYVPRGIEEELKRAIKEDGAVALIGLQGVGKSRTARQVACEP